jgi:hypothetical protein
LEVCRLGEGETHAAVDRCSRFVAKNFGSTNFGEHKGHTPVFFQRVRKAIVLFGLWIYAFWECGGY